MNKTENYQLNQWDKTDRIQMEDFNADNAKIDAALANVSQLAEKAGNCKIAAGSYVGTGTYGADNPTSLDFADTLGTAPRFIYIANGSSYYMFLLQGMTAQCASHTSTSGDTFCTITWTATGLSWYNAKNIGYQLNVSGQTYYYIALA